MKRRYYGIDGIQVAIYDGAVATLRWWPVITTAILFGILIFT